MSDLPNTIDAAIAEEAQMWTNFKFLLNHIDEIHGLVGGKLGIWQQRADMAVDGVRKLVEERDRFRHALERIELTTTSPTEAKIAAKIALAISDEQRKRKAE